MDIKEIQERFEDLLLANPDFDESLLEKDEEGSYLDSDIEHMYSMFEGGAKVREQWQAAKAQALPEWISVKDELPPTDTMVLICWSDSPDIEPEKDFMDICTDTGCPFWANYLNDMPTHWMPLPRVIVAQEPK